MLPDQVLSTQIISAPFVFPRNIPKLAKIAYEHGGVAIQDPSEGLRVKVWRMEYIEEDVVFSADGVSPTVVITVPDLVDLDASFDQNMNPFICYELEDGSAKYYWFDSTVAGFVTSTLPSGSHSLRCAHDDTRDTQVLRGVSDVILAYIRGGSLYFRAQRERYLTEHLLSASIGDRKLIKIGMNRVLRFQFQLTN